MPFISTDELNRQPTQSSNHYYQGYLTWAVFHLTVVFLLVNEIHFFVLMLGIYLGNHKGCPYKDFFIYYERTLR